MFVMGYNSRDSSVILMMRSINLESLERRTEVSIIFINHYKQPEKQHFICRVTWFTQRTTPVVPLNELLKFLLGFKVMLIAIL